MKCEACGVALTDDVAYCSHCGSAAPEPPAEPFASIAEFTALLARVAELESRVETHAEESRQAWSRLPALEDSDRRSRRILNSSSLYTDMFGWRLLTMVGYGLLSGLLVSGILLAFALATGILHR